MNRETRHIKLKQSTLAKKRNRENFLLLAPQLFLFVLLVFVPLIIALPIIFTDMSRLDDTQVSFIGFDNFTRLVDDPAVAADYWPALFKTLRFTALNYAMVYLFGLLLALLMFEVGFRGGFFTIIYLPWMVSGLALGFLALMLFSPSTGSLNLLLHDWGLLAEPFNIKSDSGTTVTLPILVGWKAAGFNMAIFLSGLLSVPRNTIEAAVVDGASYLQRLRYVYFPQMVPSFVIATIFALLGSFKVFDELVALGGLFENDSAEFLSIIFFRYGFLTNKLALAMALSVITFVPLLLIAVWLQYLQRRGTSYQT